MREVDIQLDGYGNGEIVHGGLPIAKVLHCVDNARIPVGVGALDDLDIARLTGLVDGKRYGDNGVGGERIVVELVWRGYGERVNDAWRSNSGADARDYPEICTGPNFSEPFGLYLERKRERTLIPEED